MSRPSVSVVIPSYNRARFLPAAIASIRAQTMRCQEIVVVDDGSTDDTPSALAALGEGIVHVRQTNQGPSAARNRGIREARGDLIAFLDTDDRWLPEKIEAQWNVLRGRPDIALVITDESMEDRAGHTTAASNFRLHGIDQTLQTDDDAVVKDAPRRLLTTNFVSTSTVLARRDVLINEGGFDTRLRYGEDFELWLRIAAKHPIACLKAVHAIRVTHGSNTTSTIEPMLQGYIETARTVRLWAGESMCDWGVEPSRYVANAIADLGYWYFSEGRNREARSEFLHSLRERVTRRALFYALASALPNSWIAQVREAKIRLGTG